MWVGQDVYLRWWWWGQLCTRLTRLVGFL
jgi:hypothetical protein